MYQTEGEAVHFSFFCHVEFLITSKFEYTRFLFAVTEVPLDIVLGRLKLMLNLFRIRAIEWYLKLHNKAKEHTCAKYVGS